MAGKKKKQNTTLTALGFVIVLLLGVFYTLTGQDPNGGNSDSGVPTSVVSNAPIPSNNGGSGNWWEVYFTNPVNMGDPDQWQGSIEEELIKKINAAIFPEITSILASTAYHCVASGWVQDSHGRCHPPRNSTDMNAAEVIMWAYSARKNMPNFRALYSVW